MRFTFRRSALLAAASLIASGIATPGLAQEAQPATAPEASAPTADVEQGPQDPLVIIADVPVPVAIPAEWSPIPTDLFGASAYGYYLAGRKALMSGESALGAEYLAKVQALTPEQPRVREQAFTAALLAGDLSVAGRNAPDEAAVSPVIVQAGRLIAPVQTFVDGDARAANAMLKAAPVGAPHARAGLYVQTWIAAAAGDWDRALAQPPAEMDAISLLVARSNRARLLEMARRYDEADALWKELTSHALASRLFRLPYGEFLERRGKRDEALVQYDAALTAGAGDRATQLARERVLAKGRPPERRTWQQGAADALRTAADQAIAQRAFEFGVVYLRLALNLAPDDKTRLLIGQTLREAGLEPVARVALGQIGDHDPALYAAARVQLALSLEEAGESEAALTELRRAMATLPTEPSIAYALAGHLGQMNRHEDALTILNGPLLNTPEQGFEVYFLRGVAYEALARAPEAEANLWAALQKQPNNPTVLNYLGYLWVNGGTRVEEGTAMIARAHAANPEDGNIQDSLGWAQYRRGQFDIAVDTLEQAVAKEPANPEINDHLGDAYWAVGRQREAGFQWNRVLTLEVDAERKAEVEAKLRDKLNQDPTGEKGTALGAEG